MDDTEAALEHLYRERYTRFRDGLATITGSYNTAHDVVQDAPRRRSSSGADSAARARSRAGSGGSPSAWR